MEAKMIGDVVRMELMRVSSMNTPPLPKGQRIWKPELFETRKGTRGKGMGPILAPVDSGIPYGMRLAFGFALLRSGEQGEW